MIPLDKMFGDVLRWNVLFNVPIPDDNLSGMFPLLEEGFREYTESRDSESLSDSLGDMLVIALGFCARMVVRPVRCPYLIKRAGNASKIVLNRNSLQGIIDSVNCGTSPSLALSEFLEILFIHCSNTGVDITKVFNEIMRANWTKYWTTAELKEVPSTCRIIQPIQGLVVMNKTGKVMKPPSFKHP